MAGRSKGRTGRFNMLVSEDERRMIRERAEAEGLTDSDYMRKLARDAYKATGRALSTKSPKRSRS